MDGDGPAVGGAHRGPAGAVGLDRLQGGAGCLEPPRQQFDHRQGGTGPLVGGALLGDRAQFVAGAIQFVQAE